MLINHRGTLHALQSIIVAKKFILQCSNVLYTKVNIEVEPGGPGQAYFPHQSMHPHKKLKISFAEAILVVLSVLLTKS